MDDTTAEEIEDTAYDRAKACAFGFFAGPVFLADGGGALTPLAQAELAHAQVLALLAVAEGLQAIGRALAEKS